jgi:quinol monooxygenase YgiN
MRAACRQKSRFHDEEDFMSKRIALGVVVLLGLLLGPAAGQEKENPIVSSIRARLKDPDKPFTVVVSLKVKKGAGPKLEAAFAKAIKATRKEKGCIAYDLNRDAKDPTRYVVYERWKSLADLKAHLESAHIKALFGALAGLTAGPPESRVLLPAGE